MLLESLSNISGSILILSYLILFSKLFYVLYINTEEIN